MSKSDKIIPQFVENPNLPKNDVTDVVLGAKFALKFVDFFIKKGISAHILADFDKVLPQLTSHADISMCYLGNGEAVFADISANEPLIKQLELHAFQSKSEFLSNYPGDVPLNIAIFGNFCIHNFTYTDKYIRDKIQNLQQINVKQGYSKCSTLMVDEKSIITEDIKIHKTAIRYGVGSLLIKKGFIELEGFDYGFIGGAGFKTSISSIAFTGTLDKHPDKERILKFLFDRNITVEFMTNENIFDVGSIIPIKEKKVEGIDFS